jgi:CheY-like chemotaxis protein
MSALLLTADLIVSSWARGAAARGGYPLEIAASLDALLAKAQQSSPKLVILDLGVAGLDPGDAVGPLRQLAAPPAVAAFGPHVQEGRLAAAVRAGCDLVVSRGQFHAQIDQILARFLAA